MAAIDKIEVPIEATLREFEPLLSATGITLPSKQEAEREAAEIALTWAGTFAVTFATLAKPALDAGNLATARAIVIAAAIAGGAAGIRACKPLLLKAGRSIRAARAAKTAAAAATTTAAPAAGAPTS